MTGFFGSSLFSNDLPQLSTAELNDFLESLLSVLPARVVILSQTGEIVAVNRFWCAFLEARGFTDPAYGVGESYLDLWAQIERQETTFVEISTGLRQVLSGGSSTFTLEYPETDPEGQHWTLLRASSVLIRDTRYSVLLHEDITECMQAQKQLQAIMEFPNENPNPVLQIGLDGRIVYANPASQPILYAWGCANGERLSDGWRDQFSAILNSGQPARLEVTSAERVYQLETVALPMTQSVNVYGFDITEEKQAELQLRKLSRAIEQNPSTVVITDRAGRIEYVNPKFSELTGYSAEEAIGQKPSILKSGETTAADYADLWHTITSGGIWHGEFHNRKKNGDLFWEASVICGIKDAEGQISHFVAIKEDITARKCAEEALRASEIRFRALIEKSSDAVLLVDAAGVVIYESPSAERISGYALIEQPNRLMFDQVHPDDRIPMTQLFQQLLEQPGEALITELRIRHNDGSWRWIEGVATNFFNEPSVGALVINYRDVTERKQTEQKLMLYQNHLEQLVDQRTAEIHHTNRRLEAILNNTTDGIILGSSEHGIEQANITFGKLFAWEPDDYFGKSLLLLVHPDDRERMAALIQAVVADGIGRHDDYCTVRADHTSFDARIGIGSIQAKDSMNANLLVCSVQDISEMKQRERLLRYHASLQENVADAVIATDLNFRIQSWNPAAERIYGWRAEEVVGRHITEVMPAEFASGESRGRVLRAFMKKGFWSGEVLQHRKDGRVLHSLSSTVLFKDEKGQPFGVVAVNHDITERKAAELLLQAKIQEERAFQNTLMTLHEISLELMQLDSLEAFYQHVVERGLKRLGFERLALFLYDAPTGSVQGTYGTDAQGRIRDEHAFRMLPDADDILRRVLEQSERFCLIEPATLHDNDQPIGAGWNAAAALWSGSKMMGWLVADNLIEQKPASKTQMELFALYALTVGILLGQKQASAALQESEEKFRLFVEAAPEAIVISNHQGLIVLVNAEAERLFGYRREELIGQPIELLVPEALREAHRRHHDRYTLVPSRRPMAALPELAARHKDGSPFPAEIQLSAVQMQDDLLVISFIADVSERKRAEETLQRALEQQKELVDLKSRFISMASHDFRTPLSVILSSSNLLDMQISRQFGADQREPLQKRIKRIDDSVHQMTSLLDDVLTVNRTDSGKVEIHTEYLNLERVCQGFLQEIQLTAGDQYHFTFAYSGEATPCVSDPQLLRQILINLLSNAVKYSPKGGEVGLRVRCAREGIEIEVRDAGIGIPEPDQARLFEVFHRAQNVGEIKGTGLGMAIVKRAVDALGGTISFESQIGAGTTFTVCLPTEFRPN